MWRGGIDEMQKENYFGVLYNKELPTLPKHYSSVNEIDIDVLQWANKFYSWMQVFIKNYNLLVGNDISLIESSNIIYTFINEKPTEMYLVLNAKRDEQGIWRQIDSSQHSCALYMNVTTKVIQFLTSTAGVNPIVWAVTWSVIDHGSLTGLGDDDHTQYHNDTRADTWLTTKDTGDLTEGTNLYYTDERVDDRVDSLIQDGTDISWSYNDPANTLTGNIFKNVKSKSANYPVTSADTVIEMSAAGGNRQVQLPTAVGISGKIYVVTKIDATANTVTLLPTGIETIDGAASYIINLQWDSITVISNGTSWTCI